jgi:hypothetical protein
MGTEQTVARHVSAGSADKRGISGGTADPGLRPYSSGPTSAHPSPVSQKRPRATVYREPSRSLSITATNRPVGNSNIVTPHNSSRKQVRLDKTGLGSVRHTAHPTDDLTTLLRPTHRNPIFDFEGKPSPMLIDPSDAQLMLPYHTL